MIGGLIRRTLELWRYLSDTLRTEREPMTVSATENRSGELIRDAAGLRREVESAVETTPVIDVHTHIFPPEFSALYQSGIDDLLNYHYLIAETLRSSRGTPGRFWEMTKPGQADLIWKTLFVDNTPISEACRGIITVLDAFGLDTRSPDLDEARAFFDSRDTAEHLDQVFEMSGVNQIVMTNDPFSEEEAPIWNGENSIDPRFRASLRLDGLLNNWPHAVDKFARQGFSVNKELGVAACNEVRRFLDRWIEKMRPVSLAASLPADFAFPGDDARNRLMCEAVLPIAREHNIPFALMVGVRRRVNPALREAGDSVGRADVSAIERLCEANPDIKFLATFLSRENQHELCVAARKFSNLMPFGCWWFLNNPSIVSEVTRERLELLGPSFIPQHSDARILEQLVYKWRHARTEIAEVLVQCYERLLASGRPVTREEIERDVKRMFSGNFAEWTGVGPH